MSGISKGPGEPSLSAEELYRELHDGLCQSITASLFFAQNLRSRLQKADHIDEAMLPLADKVVNAATNATTDMRALLKKLADDQPIPGNAAGRKGRD